MSNVTKKDVVLLIANKLGHHDLKHLSDFVDAFIEVVTEKLSNNERIEFRNFGIFELKPRKEKKGRNITLNQIVVIPKQSVVKFTPGKELAEKAKKYGESHSEFFS